MLAQKTDSTAVVDTSFCPRLRCHSCEFRGRGVLDILSTCIKINGFVFSFCLIDNKEMVVGAVFEQVEFSQQGRVLSFPAAKVYAAFSCKAC